MATGLCPHRFSHLHSTPHCRASHPSRLRLRARYWRMANITSATQDGARFTKPADWALHMVTASLKFSCSNDAPVSYTTPDAGRLGVLNVLNWHEAHDDYEWPDFIQLGHDFTQAMRFRRGLVNDVFLALEKAGVIKITGEPGVLGTPQSSAVKRRAGVSVAIRMSERKRHCSRESSSNEIASDKEIPYYETDRFLAKSMRCLIEYAGFPVDDCIADLEEGDHLSEEDLADTIKDLVAQVWNAEDDPRSMKRVGNIAFSKSGSGQAPRISSPEL